MAVFSVGKRQAEMFMAAAVEKIDLAFAKGTHVRKQDFNFIRNSLEMLIIEHPMGGKNSLGCFPDKKYCCFVIVFLSSFTFVKGK